MLRNVRMMANAIVDKLLSMRVPIIRRSSPNDDGREVTSTIVIVYKSYAPWALIRAPTFIRIIGARRHLLLVWFVWPSFFPPDQFPQRNFPGTRMRPSIEYDNFLFCPVKNSKETRKRNRILLQNSTKLTIQRVPIRGLIFHKFEELSYAFIAHVQTPPGHSWSSGPIRWHFKTICAEYTRKRQLTGRT